MSRRPEQQWLAPTEVELIPQAPAEGLALGRHDVAGDAIVEGPDEPWPAYWGRGGLHLLHAGSGAAVGVRALSHDGPKPGGVEIFVSHTPVTTLFLQAIGPDRMTAV